MGRLLAVSLWVATGVLATAAVAGLVGAFGHEPGATVRATSPRAPAATERGVATALDALLRTTWTPRIFVDLSKEMDRRVRLAPAPPEVVRLLGVAPYAPTPRRFAARFVELFDAAARRGPTVVALGEGRPAGGPELLDRVQPLDLGQLLALPQAVVFGERAAQPRRLDLAWEGPTLAVVIVGSPDMHAAAASLAPRNDGSRSVVLVIDLSADGGGSRIAEAFDVPPFRVAAYWSPVVAVP